MRAQWSIDRLLVIPNWIFPNEDEIISLLSRFAGLLHKRDRQESSFWNTSKNFGRTDTLTDTLKEQVDKARLGLNSTMFQ